MATSTILKEYRKVDYGRTAASIQEIDISRYYASNNRSWAILIVAQGWVAGQNGLGVYAVGCTYNQSFSTVLTLSKGSLAPTIALSGSTLTITWYNDSGGTISILPLIN